jgi:uncharacterized membrane protein
VVQIRDPLLHIDARTHVSRGTNDDPDLAAIHVLEQFQLVDRVGIVGHEGHMLLLDPAFPQSTLQPLPGIEPTIRRHTGPESQVGEDQLGATLDRFRRPFGFLLGVLGMFASALFTGGIGPWLSYQLFAAGIIGLLAGSFAKKLRGWGEIALLILISVFSALSYGLLMDLQFWPWALGANTQLSFIPGGALSENLHRFITFHFLSSMAWDIPRAVLTTVLVVSTGPAVLAALRRTKNKAAFLTPIEFSERLK